MAGLFDMLGSAARALEAQRFALDVVGQNIANVNTPGYARRRPLLSEALPGDRRLAGGSVQVDGVAAARNRYVELRLWAEHPAEQREGAVAEALAPVETAIGDSGATLNSRLSQFFDAFAHLSDAPTSAIARQEVVLQGRAVAVAFNQMSDTLVTAQRDADLRVRGTVDDINALAARIAQLNDGLSSLTAASGQGLHLRDEVRKAVEDLSKLVKVEAIERSDGGFDVAIGSGRALVIGDRSWALSVSSRPVTGLADVVTSDGAVITDELQGGAIAGYVEARDTLIPGYRTSLDDLAYGLVEQVNTLHTAGFDRNGAAGLPFFDALASSTDAAENIAVNVALLAPGGESLVVASNDPAAVGDNSAARALAKLRDSTFLAGGTATVSDYWSRLVYRVGRDAEAARDEQQSRAELVQQVQALQESNSGVSLDEEAADLLRFQRAYEANARYFQSVDDTLSTLMQMVGA